MRSVWIGISISSLLSNTRAVSQDDQIADSDKLTYKHFLKQTITFSVGWQFYFPGKNFLEHRVIKSC